MSCKFSVILLLLSVYCLSQNRITVYDGQSDQIPVSGAEIFSKENKRLGETDSKGIFTIPSGITEISIFHPEYEETKVKLKNNNQKIYLKPVIIELDVTELSGDDSEARKLINLAIQNRKKNSTKNLKTYQYKSYTKFLVTASTDSMPYILLPKNEKDSSYNDVRKLLDDSHIMLGERAMDHKFSDRFGNKNIVKAARLSGTQLPMFEFAAMQPISLDFSEEKLSLFFNEFSNPVSKNGLRNYRYRITGEEEINGKKLIEIAFFPVNRTSKGLKLKGYIWLEKGSYALVRYYAESLSEKRIAEIEMDWTPFNGYWFPQQQRLRMESGTISYPFAKDSIHEDGTVSIDTIRKREKVWLHLTTSFKDIESPKEFDKKEFRGYEDEIDLVTVEDSDAVLDDYRDNPLTAREQMTYIKIDSIGKEYKFDRAIRLMKVITSGGKYDIGKIDIDLTQILNFNNYEGFRLGIGGNTNHKFSQDFSLNGYLAYGFRDAKFKFGLGTEFFVNKAYSGKIFANYRQDVDASGKHDLELQNNYIKFIEKSLSNIYNDKFYSFKEASLGYEQDLFSNVSFRLTGIYSEKKAEFDYAFLNNPADKIFKSFDTRLAVRWAPRERMVRTPYGKVTLSTGLPIFYFSVTQGLDLFKSDYKSTQLDFAYLDNFDSFLGNTDIQLKAGLISGDTPLFNMYEGMGNARSSDKIFKKFGMAGVRSFETMLPGEFYSDRYLSFQISQRFFGFKLMKKRIFPEFIYRGLVGDMKNPGNHLSANFNTPSKYYQEAGIEFNQLFMGLVGIGTYYRFGSYAHDIFDKNFFIKMTFKLNIF